MAGYVAGTPSFSVVDISAIISTNGKYEGAVLLPSGKVLFVPRNAEKVGLFDPATDTFSLVGPIIAGDDKYIGGVLLLSGKVVFVPSKARNVGVFDPATDAFTTVDISTSTEVAKYRGCPHPQP